MRRVTTDKCIGGTVTAENPHSNLDRGELFPVQIGTYLSGSTKFPVASLKVKKLPL